MTIQIRGTAHPPPGGCNSDPADLNAAEIGTTNVAGRPLLNEHDSSARVGTCLASWEGTRGELRIAAEVSDPAAIEQVRNGSLRGLSLGTDMVLDQQGDVLYKKQAELSICAEGRRPGTWITEVDGKVIHRHATFSKDEWRRKSNCRTFKPCGTLDHTAQTAKNHNTK